MFQFVKRSSGLKVLYALTGRHDMPERAHCMLMLPMPVSIMPCTPITNLSPQARSPTTLL